MNTKKLSELIESNSKKYQVEEFHILCKNLHLNNEIKIQAFEHYDYFSSYINDFMCRHFKENKHSKLKHFSNYMFLIDYFDTFIDVDFYDWFNKNQVFYYEKYTLHKDRTIRINEVKYFGTFFNNINIYEIKYQSKFSSFSDTIYVGVKM